MDKTLYCKSSSFESTRYSILIFLVVLLLASPCKKKQPEIHILFVGDILVSRNVQQEIQARNSSPWADLKSLFRSADLVVGNLEGAVGKNTDQLPSNSGSPVFNIENTDIKLLKDAGFKAITLENNHSLDLGGTGKIKTIESLRNSDITPVYQDNSPQFFTIKEVVIALLAINLVPERDLNKNEIPSVEIKQKLRLAKSMADVVIVSIHWGSELLDWPNEEQRKAAKWLISNGVDIIIGSHPHVIQEPEMIDGKPVFFSLGNHLFDQKYADTKKGLMVDIRIRNGKFQCFGIETRTKKNSFYPEISKNKDYKFGLISLNNKKLNINGYEIKPLSGLEKSQTKIILEAFKDGKKCWSTLPMSIVSITTSKLDGKNDFLFMLEKHYSSIDKEINLRPYVYSVDNNGLIPHWRGSALAWPLLDAVILPLDDKVLCALHRGDSFINLDNKNTYTRVVAYKWNGFGFSGENDSIICKNCEGLLGNNKPANK